MRIISPLDLLILILKYIMSCAFNVKISLISLFLMVVFNNYSNDNDININDNRGDINWNLPIRLKSKQMIK